MSATLVPHDYINDFSTTLSTGYTAGGTSLVLTSATGSNGLVLPSTGYYYYLKCEDEYFLVTARSGTTCTVVGGKAGSTNTSHSSGTVVTGCWVLPDVLDSIRDYRVDIMNGKPFGTKKSQTNEYVSFTNGSTINLIDVSDGPGIIDSIWVALPKHTIKIYIDGELVPSVSVDSKYFFYSKRAPNPMATPIFLIGSDANTDEASASYVPIPYSSSIQITATNTSGSNSSAFSIVTYQTGIPNVIPYSQKLFCSAGVISGAIPNQVCTLADITTSKRGRILGIYWSIDAPNQFPLEGDFNFYVDGSGSPSLTSSGTEDFFFMAGYFGGFSQGAVMGDSIALTYKNAASGQFAAFRLFLKDPFLFNTGFKVTWQAGETAHQNWTGTLDVYYSILYYTEL